MAEVSARHLALAGERGLANPVGHNNCFLNSVLQVLYHLRDFRTQLIAAAAEALGAGFCDDDDADNDDEDAPSPPPPASSTSAAPSTEQRLLRRVAALFLRYQRSSSDDALLDPSAIRSGISRALPGYAAGEMQDAHECLDAVLAMLDKGLREGAGAAAAAGEARPRRRGRQRQQQPQPQPLTLPYRYFGVHTRVSPACGCGEASGRVVDTDAFYLTMWEPALVREGFDCGNPRAFHDLIAGRGRDAPIECDACKTKGVELETRLRPVERGQAGKQAKSPPAVLCPPVLVVNVSWAEASATREELRRFVSCVPVRWRVADALPGAPEDVEAELVSVVFYYGQHYVTALRNEEHNVWAIFDDSRVRSVAHSIPELWRHAVDGCLMPFVLFFRSAKTGGGAETGADAAAATAAAAAASRLGEPDLDSTSPSYNPSVLHSWLVGRTRADLPGGAASSPPPSGTGTGADAEAAAAVAAVAEAEAKAAAEAAAAADAAEAAEVAAAAEAAEAAAAACKAENEVLRVRRSPPPQEAQEPPPAKRWRRAEQPSAPVDVVGSRGNPQCSHVFSEAMGGVADEELRLEMSRLQGKTPQALLNYVSGRSGCDLDASLTADEFLTLSSWCRPHQ